MIPLKAQLGSKHQAADSQRVARIMWRFVSTHLAHLDTCAQQVFAHVHPRGEVGNILTVQTSWGALSARGFEQTDSDASRS